MANFCLNITDLYVKLREWDVPPTTAEGIKAVLGSYQKLMEKDDVVYFLTEWPIVNSRFVEKYTSFYTLRNYSASALALAQLEKIRLLFTASEGLSEEQATERELYYATMVGKIEAIKKEHNKAANDLQRRRRPSPSENGAAHTEQATEAAAGGDSATGQVAPEEAAVVEAPPVEEAAESVAATQVQADSNSSPATDDLKTEIERLRRSEQRYKDALQVILELGGFKFSNM